MKNPNEMTVKRTKEKKRGKVDEKKTRESVRSLSKVKKVQILSPRQPPFKNVDELLQCLFWFLISNWKTTLTLHSLLSTYVLKQCYSQTLTCNAWTPLSTRLLTHYLATSVPLTENHFLNYLPNFVFSGENGKAHTIDYLDETIDCILPSTNTNLTSYLGNMLLHPSPSPAIFAF